MSCIYLLSLSLYTSGRLSALCKSMHVWILMLVTQWNDHLSLAMHASLERVIQYHYDAICNSTLLGWFFYQRPAWTWVPYSIEKHSCASAAVKVDQMQIDKLERASDKNKIAARHPNPVSLLLPMTSLDLVRILFQESWIFSFSVMNSPRVEGAHVVAFVIRQSMHIFVLPGKFPTWWLWSKLEIGLHLRLSMEACLPWLDMSLNLL